MDDFRVLIEKLYRTGWLQDAEFLKLLSNHEDEKLRKLLAEFARRTAQRYYGNKVYNRGLIEFSNYCKNDCYYCGIRRSNTQAQRYRLEKKDILSCCEEGYRLGFRTFVLQSGEDGFYTDDILTDIIVTIKSKYPDCALTLSLGEKDKESYQRFYDAGADRYLLRHETSNEKHYRCLHPQELTIAHRKQCLWDLKSIGFQTGCGIMVGSPSQALQHIIEDLHFMKELQPEMVGIGPFLPHHDTPFRNEKPGSYTLTLTLLSIIRLILPDVLLPATTALGTIHPKGREQGILAGANVVMPNLSPVAVRKKYMLYDNKICTGDEAAECRVCLSNRMRSIGYELVTDRGDSIRKIEEKRICTINIH